MGFAFGWTLGFFYRGCGLPREIEPQKSWANVCGSLLVRRGLFILFFPPFFFPPPFCSFVLPGSLARSFSRHEWKDNIDLCLSCFFFFFFSFNFPGRAANARPNKIWSCVLLTYELLPECTHISERPLCVCLFLTHGQTKRPARRGQTQLKRIWSRCFTVLSLTSFHQLSTSSFSSSFSLMDAEWFCAVFFVQARWSGLLHRRGQVFQAVDTAQTNQRTTWAVGLGFSLYIFLSPYTICSCCLSLWLFTSHQTIRKTIPREISF